MEIFEFLLGVEGAIVTHFHEHVYDFVQGLHHECGIWVVGAHQERVGDLEIFVCYGEVLGVASVQVVEMVFACFHRGCYDHQRFAGFWGSCCACTYCNHLLYTRTW